MLQYTITLIVVDMGGVVKKVMLLLLFIGSGVYNIEEGHVTLWLVAGS